MVSNTRDRNIDSSRREDSRKGQVDRCEVINVRPHKFPYPADKNFNTVDVQLIDRPRVAGEPLTINYVKLNSLQREHGRFQGHPWNARIGDMVYIYWLAEREALVLGTCTSVEQEPICRSQADDQQQEYVCKLCPHEEPSKNQDGNYVDFPLPKHPDCHKWWPKTRDSIQVFDCKNGHDRAQCDRQAPCNNLDDITERTWIKNFSDISPTVTDLPWRYKFHHNSNSVVIFDDDKTIHIANKTNCATCGGTGVDGQCATCGGTGLEGACPTCNGTSSTGICALCNGTGVYQDVMCPRCLGTGKEICATCGGSGKTYCETCGGSGDAPCQTCGGCGGTELGHQHHYPTGTIDIHAGQEQPNKNFIDLATEDSGVRVAVVHPDDESVEYAFEAKDFATGAYIRILKTTGEIKLYSPFKITLDAPVVDVKHDLHVYEDEQVDGTCSGPNNVV